MKGAGELLWKLALAPDVFDEALNNMVWLEILGPSTTKQSSMLSSSKSDGKSFVVAFTPRPCLQLLTFSVLVLHMV